MNTSSAAWQANGTNEPAPPALQDEREDLRLGRRIATVAAIAALFAAYVLHAALPAAPFQLPLVQKRVIQTVIPEGWAFFTLSPRSADVVVYGARPDHTWQQLTLNAHSGSGTLLGLNRRNRSQGTEVASIANQVPPEVWFDCHRAPLDCLSTLTAQRTVPNTAIQKTLCGELGLIMQEVLPWAWRDLSANMPAKVVRVVVTC